MGWKNELGDMYPYSFRQRLERTLSSEQLFLFDFVLVTGGTILLLVLILFPFRQELAAYGAFRKKYDCQVIERGFKSIPTQMFCSKPAREQMSFDEFKRRAIREAGLN